MRPARVGRGENRRTEPKVAKFARNCLHSFTVKNHSRTSIFPLHWVTTLGWILTFSVFFWHFFIFRFSLFLPVMPLFLEKKNPKKTFFSWIPNCRKDNGVLSSMTWRGWTCNAMFFSANRRRMMINFFFRIYSQLSNFVFSFSTLGKGFWVLCGCVGGRGWAEISAICEDLTWMGWIGMEWWVLSGNFTSIERSDAEMMLLMMQLLYYNGQFCWFAIEIPKVLSESRRPTLQPAKRDDISCAIFHLHDIWHNWHDQSHLTGN